jgi:hypothetical protein
MKLRNPFKLKESTKRNIVDFISNYLDYSPNPPIHPFIDRESVPIYKQNYIEPIQFHIEFTIDERTLAYHEGNKPALDKLIQNKIIDGCSKIIRTHYKSIFTDPIINDRNLPFSSSVTTRFYITPHPDNKR